MIGTIIDSLVYPSFDYDFTECSLMPHREHEAEKARIYSQQSAARSEMYANNDKAADKAKSAGAEKAEKEYTLRRGHGRAVHSLTLGASIGARDHAD